MSSRDDLCTIGHNGHCSMTLRELACLAEMGVASLISISMFVERIFIIEFYYLYCTDLKNPCVLFAVVAREFPALHAPAWFWSIAPYSKTFQTPSSLPIADSTIYIDQQESHRCNLLGKLLGPIFWSILRSWLNFV